MDIHPEFSSNVEHIMAGGRRLAYVVRAQFQPTKTTFVTQNDDKQQLGFIVYPKGGEVARHVHKPLQRQLVGTSEVILVQRGRCIVDFYDDDKTLVISRELGVGDVMVMVGGGHGFRMLEDTVLLEVKQGPYTGMDEKERF